MQQSCEPADALWLKKGPHLDTIFHSANLLVQR